MGLAALNGLKIAAAGTQEITSFDRYLGFEQDMQDLAHQLIAETEQGVLN